MRGVTGQLRLAALLSLPGVLLVLLIPLTPSPVVAAGAPYPFPAPAVQCRRDLAWLRLAMPEARVFPGPVTAPDRHDGEVFTPVFPGALPSALRVWHQLQQSRYCGLARALRHRVA